MQRHLPFKRVWRVSCDKCSVEELNRAFEAGMILRVDYADGKSVAVVCEVEDLGRY